MYEKIVISVAVEQEIPHRKSSVGGIYTPTINRVSNVNSAHDRTVLHPRAQPFVSQQIMQRCRCWYRTADEL